MKFRVNGRRFSVEVNLRFFESRNLPRIFVSVKRGMNTCVKGAPLSFKTRRVISRSPSSASSDHATTVGKSEMQALNADVQNRILALVKAILEQNAIAVEVDPESRLVDIGLTSMDMVNLMLGVEAEFDLTIPQSEITPENFQSVKALELMIIVQLEPATAA
jgi:acyl carrier protein